MVILGKTNSGKNLISDILIKKYGCRRIITYTTRPMRDVEIQGETYHFISEEEFQNKINDGFFAEWKSYNSAFGIWYYGTSLPDMQNIDSDNSIIILTPDGYKDIKSKLGYYPKSVYIYVNNDTMRQRASSRGDKKEEIERRIQHDNIDFKGLGEMVDRVIYNNTGSDINEVAAKVYEEMRKKV